ncbi:2OG-Fe(II) oxygenase [Tsuneonella deserti]|uniref:2OG-Fe(II) oxygenase n=1 Tax=Tsuneonella deserti TaxID=2035528 RepID=A0ABQ1SAU6_9SPHN|nr:alpha-ketoglutarate-dependent dioxygenase AlkB [Tsuneonella deserti]GGD99551.1 2OG-Fe(II) oxygenase [Tsuneonella deserti]
MTGQLSLFAEAPAAPAIEGLRLIADAIPPDVEDEIAARIDSAPLTPFQFGQWEGKRLTANYGSAYDYTRARPTPAPPLPAWLVAVRDDLAKVFGLDPASFVQGLLIRYDPGAGIGWHRDRPQYGRVIGLSLSAPIVMRFRRTRREGGFERVGVPLPPRSAYLLDGPARWEWQHSIRPVEETRRSVTLRTMV